MSVGEVEFIGHDVDATDLAVSLSGGDFGAVKNPGQDIRYQITLTNNGPNSASDVTLSNPIPGNTSFVSFTQDSGPAFTASTPAVGSAGSLSATIASLDPGESAVFTVLVRVNDSTIDNTIITNTTTATTSKIELNSNNSSVTANTNIKCPAITLLSAPLANGDTTSPYSQTISASGGTGNYTFAVAAGSLPNGLTLGSNGVISGTPTKTGTFNFSVQANDAANSCPGTGSSSIQIGCGILTIASQTLPHGVTSAPDGNQTITASGGTAPYSTLSLMAHCQGG